MFDSEFEAQAAAGAFGLKIHVVQASTEREFDPDCAALVQLRAGVLVIGNDPFLTAHVQQLGALTLRHAVPAIFQYREFTAAGGLMSYGGGLADWYRLVGRILRGDKPADLPVQLIHPTGSSLRAAKPEQQRSMGHPNRSL
jgi:putative ABC transport system substrate-binding protein